MLLHLYAAGRFLDRFSHAYTLSGIHPPHKKEDGVVGYFALFKNYRTGEHRNRQ